jgi:uncharacterized protein (UPF0332 family)
MTDDLEREHLIKKIPYDEKKVADALALADRDITTARTILSHDRDWAYTIAYNAALSAGRALMFSRGFRPDGANQHIAVVRFASIYLDEQDAIAFERMRRKRHSTVYDTAGTVSRAEAESAIRMAEKILGTIRELIMKKT